MVSRFSRICLFVAGAGAIALFAPSQMAAARQQTLPAPVAPTAEEVVAAPPIRPALWLVRDADTTIYLFGTVHLLKPGLNWLNGPVADGLARSDTLVTEIVKTRESDAAMQKAVEELAMLPETLSLRTLMLPAARTSFEALLKRQGMPVDLFDRFEPWYPALVLSMLPLMKQALADDLAMVSEPAVSEAAASQLVSADCGCLFNITGRAAKQDEVAGVSTPSLPGEHLASFLWRRTTATTGTPS